MILMGYNQLESGKEFLFDSVLEVPFLHNQIDGALEHIHIQLKSSWEFCGV